MPNNTGSPLIILKTDDQEKAIEVLQTSDAILIPSKNVYQQK
jgi:hypothetical protein